MVAENIAGDGVTIHLHATDAPGEWMIERTPDGFTYAHGHGKGDVALRGPISDLTAGNLLALGIMMALFDRTRTGVGRWVHTSLLESLIFMLDLQGSRYLVKGEVAKQAGNDHPTLTPTGVFPTSDGYMNIAASSGRLWERLCDVLGHAEWKTKPEWTTVVGRTKDRAGVNGAISAVTKTQTGEYWTEKFDAAGIPAGLTPPDGGFPASFHPWLSGARDGVFFSQYTLGWPLVLFVGVALAAQQPNTLTSADTAAGWRL